jgi:hypothetical protein
VSGIGGSSGSRPCLPRAGGGAAVAGGGSTSLENDKGVQIKVVSSAEGLQFKLAPEGVTIRLK